jgi:NADH-quinone oxidoreductase subunit G
MQLPHIFGSDELSRQALPIVERLPAFCAWLHPQDAEALGVAGGDSVCISDLLAIAKLTLPVQIEKTLARGLLGITAGQAEPQFMKTGTLVTVTKVYAAQQADAEISL